MNGKQVIGPVSYHGNLIDATNEALTHESARFDFRTSAQALDVLLRNPVRFVPATHLTFEDEKRMAPSLRPHHVDQNPRDTQNQPLCKILVGYSSNTISELTPKVGSADSVSLA